MRKPHIIPSFFLHSHARKMKFLLLFVIILLAGHVISQISYLKIAPFLINTLHAKVGAAVIVLISYDESVTALNNTIPSKTRPCRS